ncbi:hypothetical protein DSO57_1015491 [Entomophthora muscae]|uniref:Uncharacterized protein n=1 Tax=Entomophthora muscae TaxID=34485 RepID=A0ACC2UEV2_9FUNG|nr:hypothetical protein DSO57_1015491 [Entomophthora muscae]
MFGDEDSDSGRSCSVSLNSSMRNQNITGTSSLSVNSSRSNEKNKAPAKTEHQPHSSVELTPGYAISKSGLSITPSSPSTRLEITNAQRSPIMPSTSIIETSNPSSRPHSAEPEAPSPVQTSSNQDSPAHVVPTVAPLRPTDIGPRLTASSSGSSLNNAHSGPHQSTQQQLTRTQQKLLLQRQHLLSDDDHTVAHPQNHLRLTKEAERVNREYGWTRRHHNPVFESLMRVMSQKPGNSNTFR